MTQKLPEAPPSSLSDSYRSVRVPENGGFWRKIFAFAGPGYLIAVGYMDPGNWATDIAAGSAYGYKLLSVVMLSNFLAILLQALSARLGIASGLDLAQACRRNYPKTVNFALWVLCEIAICACDLAEIIGTAIGLQLLFHIPQIAGIGIAAFDTLIILALQNRGFRYLEAFIITLIVIVAVCFGAEMALARPDIHAAFAEFMPDAGILKNPGMLYIAIGILGATVMPHNLYLHSAIVKTRDVGAGDAAKREAIKLATIDSTAALMFALFINAAILIMAAAVFNRNGYTHVAEIQEAYKLLTPLLGAGAGSFLFALALLASGQNSTITATLAGQVVMEGFLNLRIAPWLRRMITRGAAIIPAGIVCVSYGESGTARLLILSQVILSLQLPFAVWPLAQFTASGKTMGAFKSGALLSAAAWAACALIVVLNAELLIGLIQR